MNDASGLTVIEVFADVVCPFAHVGIRRWVERRDELGRTDVRLRVRAWPLELINGAPMDPQAVAGKAEDLQAQVAPNLFGGFDPAHFPSSSLPALALTHAAYRRSLEAGEATALRLRQLTFDEGVDVSKPEVIDQVIDELDLPIPDISDDDSVTKDWDEGRQRGVVGSPHFFTPRGGAVFCPTLDIHKEGGHLAVHFDEDAFAQLTAICFG
ncbi:MAG: DsbA family protein [Acidimicrobiia bacterium]|nr:DsbA family protein [Acidimicrobiia bacterium]MDH5289811.1 DsbA family protein [Acidimicrobiia bacterium]